MRFINGDVVAAQSVLSCPACGHDLQLAAWPPVADQTDRELAPSWDCVRRHAAFLPHDEWQVLRLHQLVDVTTHNETAPALEPRPGRVGS